MIASPHFKQMRLVRWLASSRFASEARAVFESSPFLGIDSRPLSPIFLLCFCVPGNGGHRSAHIELTTVYHRMAGMSNLAEINACCEAEICLLYCVFKKGRRCEAKSPLISQQLFGRSTHEQWLMIPNPPLWRKKMALFIFRTRRDCSLAG